MARMQTEVYVPSIIITGTTHFSNLQCSSTMRECSAWQGHEYKASQTAALLMEHLGTDGVVA